MFGIQLNRCIKRLQACGRGWQVTGPRADVTAGHACAQRKVQPSAHHLQRTRTLEQAHTLLLRESHMHAFIVFMRLQTTPGPSLASMPAIRGCSAMIIIAFRRRLSDSWCGFRLATCWHRAAQESVSNSRLSITHISHRLHHTPTMHIRTCRSKAPDDTSLATNTETPASSSIDCSGVGSSRHHISAVGSCGAQLLPASRPRRLLRI